MIPTHALASVQETQQLPFRKPRGFQLRAAGDFYAGFIPGSGMAAAAVDHLTLAFRLDSSFEAVAVALQERGAEVIAEYTPEYFTGMDHIAFRSPHTPPKATPVSDTGYRSHFVPREDVDALGGPAEYATQYGEAVAVGRESQFLTTFKGTPLPEPKPKRKARVVVGKHTAKVEHEPGQESHAANVTKPKETGLFG